MNNSSNMPVFDFIALDVENANNFPGSLCQIAAVRFTQGKPDGDPFVTTIRPESSVEAIGHQWHKGHLKITQEDIAFAPSMPEIWPDFLEYIGDLPIVAHNAGTDRAKIIQAMEIWGQKVELPKFICTQKIAKHLEIPDGKKGIAELVGRYEIELTDHHFALADAMACGQVFLAMVKELGRIQLVEFKPFEVGDYTSATARNSREVDILGMLAPRASESVNRNPAFKVLDDLPHDSEVTPLYDGELIALTDKPSIFRDKESIYQWITILGGISGENIKVRRGISLLVQCTREQKYIAAGKLTSTNHVKAIENGIPVIDEIDFARKILSHIGTAFDF